MIWKQNKIIICIFITKFNPNRHDVLNLCKIKNLIYIFLSNNLVFIINYINYQTYSKIGFNRMLQNLYQQYLKIQKLHQGLLFLMITIKKYQNIKDYEYNIKINNSNFFMIIIILLILFSQIKAAHQLKIYNPQQLALMFPNNRVTLHASAIGFTPRQSNIYGILSLANPYDACTKIQKEVDEQKTFGHRFIMANSQNCANSAKANNIFLSDGYAAIIIKNNATIIQKHGTKINIPVLEISQNDAKIISDYQHSNPEIIITASIESSTKKKSDKVQVEIWMSSTQKYVYDFLIQFGKFYNPQNQSINFQPRYVLSQKDDAGKPLRYIGCLSSGRYCAPEIQYQIRFQGAQVVAQDLRQIIIYKKYPQLWWSYIQYWATDCLNKLVFETTNQAKKCSQKAMLRAGINIDQIQNQFYRSFRGYNVQVDDNQYLLQQRQDYIIQRVEKYPVIMLNRKLINTNADLVGDQDYVQHEICKKQSPNFSDSCKSLSKKFSGDEENNQGWIIALIITIAVILIVSLLALYKIILRMKMKKQIESDVQKTLEQYYKYQKNYKLNEEKL